MAICFDSVLLRGNRSTKVDNGSFDAFASPNMEPLAEVGVSFKGLQQQRFQPQIMSSMFYYYPQEYYVLCLLCLYFGCSFPYILLPSNPQHLLSVCINFKRFHISYSNAELTISCLALSLVSTTRVHGPSWRPVNSGAFFDTRVDGPSWWVSKNAPELTARQLGCIFWHPTRVVETGL